MARMPAVKGTTPEDRREAREDRRRVNRLDFINARTLRAKNGREVLVVASNAVLAVGRDLTDEGRRKLAAAVLEAIQRADIEENRKTK